MAATSKKSWPTDLNINPKRQRLLLSALPEIPYTVYTHPSFNIQSKVSDLTLSPEGERKRFLNEEDQVEMWQECAKSARGDENSPGGWTAIFAGKAPINYGECLAAHLAALVIDSGRNAMWIDVGEALGKRAYTVDAVAVERQRLVGAPLALVIVTGLRGTSPDVKWDRAFDLLRSTSVNSSRVVIATGVNPSETKAKLGLSPHRMVNLVANSSTTII